MSPAKLTAAPASAAASASSSTRIRPVLSPRLCAVSCPSMSTSSSFVSVKSSASAMSTTQNAGAMRGIVRLARLPMRKSE